MTIRALILLSFLAVPIFAGSDAQAQSCGDLWYQRNSIYKQAGYCFKTARAIRAFGNAVYDSEYNLPLSPSPLEDRPNRQRRAESGLSIALQ